MRIIKKLASPLLGACLLFSGCGLERKVDPVNNWQEYTLLFSLNKTKKEIWQSPAMAEKSKIIDCKDAAVISAKYCGERYGNNLLILFREKENGETAGHVVHLLIENGKYGCRGGFLCDNFPVEYSLKELIGRIQEKQTGVLFYAYQIVNLDEMNKDWKETERDLSQDYIRLWWNGEVKTRYIKNDKRDGY